MVLPLGRAYGLTSPNQSALTPVLNKRAAEFPYRIQAAQLMNTITGLQGNFHMS